jgi:hypothetical protein
LSDEFFWGPNIDNKKRNLIFDRRKKEQMKVNEETKKRNARWQKKRREREEAGLDWQGLRRSARIAAVEKAKAQADYAEWKD